MQSVNSFDIFDTLVARTVINPTDIFDIVELYSGYNNFKSIRLHSQNISNHTYSDIYNKFKQLTNESDEKIQELMNIELNTEIENTLPIYSNISKIRDGDIYISDMYLPEESIRKILDHHNINKNNKLYVSSSGKSSGYMWEQLSKKYIINKHLGDNMHSDINMAKQYNIQGVYTEIYKFSEIEKILLQKDKNVCTIIRKNRLLNPYEENTIEYKLYEEQYKYNIPILLFICVQLKNILDSENRDTVLFTTRDGCLLIKLFSYIYPEYKSIEYNNSRIMNNNYNNEYIEYIKSIYNKEKCIIFDLHGSFATGRKMFLEVFGSLPRTYIFDYIPNRATLYDGMTYVTTTGNAIEGFNSDIIGTMVSYKNNRIIRAPLEINREYAKIQHKTIDNFINNNTKDVLYNILKSDIFNDMQLWKDFYRINCNNYKSILTNQFDFLSLTDLANKYNSDKGNQYMCAHHYTIMYEEIIHNIVNEQMRDNIDLLEIGLNRSDTGSIPSLMIWNDYFNKNVNITGFDIEPSFSKFNGKYNNIKIKIGDQSNINDLQQLKDKQYDIIIDDGWHATKHQQISFKILWENVKPGGYYIIEDLHYQPEKDSCMPTRELFENLQNNNIIATDYITKEEILSIITDIKSINFYDSKSKRWDNLKNSFVYIKKK